MMRITFSHGNRIRQDFGPFLICASLLTCGSSELLLLKSCIIFMFHPTWIFVLIIYTWWKRLTFFNKRGISVYAHLMYTITNECCKHKLDWNRKQSNEQNIAIAEWMEPYTSTTATTGHRRPSRWRRIELNKAIHTQFDWMPHWMKRGLRLCRWAFQIVCTKSKYIRWNSHNAIRIRFMCLFMCTLCKMR